MSDAPITLAQYSRAKVIVCCIGAATCSIYVLMIPFISPGGSSAYFADNNHSARIFPFIALLVPIAVFFIFRLAMNTLWNRLPAISLDENVLRLASGKIVSIDRRKIRSVGISKGGFPPFRFTYLDFYVEESGNQKISSFLFNEPAGTVCDRIQAALAVEKSHRPIGEV